MNDGVQDRNTEKSHFLGFSILPTLLQLMMTLQEYNKNSLGTHDIYTWDTVPMQPGTVLFHCAKALGTVRHSMALAPSKA